MPAFKLHAGGGAGGAAMPRLSDSGARRGGVAPKTVWRNRELQAEEAALYYISEKSTRHVCDRKSLIPTARLSSLTYIYIAGRPRRESWFPSREGKTSESRGPLPDRPAVVRKMRSANPMSSASPDAGARSAPDAGEPAAANPLRPASLLTALGGTTAAAVRATAGGVLAAGRATASLTDSAAKATAGGVMAAGRGALSATEAALRRKRSGETANCKPRKQHCTIYPRRARATCVIGKA